MTIDISYIEKNLPEFSDQIFFIKRRVDILTNGEYKFIFTDCVPDIRKTIKLGMAWDVEENHKFEQAYENDKTYLNSDVERILNGLVEGIIEECRKRNTKEVIVLLPEAPHFTRYICTYIQDDRVILAGFVSLYFNDQ